MVDLEAAERGDAQEQQDEALARVARSFARQVFMRHIGAELGQVSPGRVVMGLPFSDALAQQHGYIHAGATASIVDSAAGYAALTQFPSGVGVLTTEMKINLLRPATGPELRAVGEVVKPGRTLSVCRGDVYAAPDPSRPEARETRWPDVPTDGKHVATGLFTMMQAPGIED